MDRVTRALSALLWHAARLLPADRREWAEAAWAEATEVPSGRPRLAWLAGGLWMAAGQAGALRRAGYWLVFGMAAASVVRIGWPGAAASPATLINRVDVIAVVAILAGLPWAARQRFGPVGGSRLARVMRAAGYGVILALVLVKASAERFGNPPGGNYGVADTSVLWAGEIIFLVVMAAYVGGLLAVTARRSPAAPTTLAIGTAAGGVAGLVMYARTNLHVTNPGLAAVSAAATVLTWAVLLSAPIAAGLVAARRTPGQGRLPLADARPRQGVAAGLCAGIAAALVVSVLGTGMTALLPHAARFVSWAYPIRHLAHGALYRYEVNVSQNAALYIFALLFFPLLGAGLGAWGGLAVAGRPGHRPGGGGGGPSAPPPPPPPPAGGRERGYGHQPSLSHTGRHIMFPAGNNLSQGPGEQHPAPDHPERIPITVGQPSTRT